MEARLENIFQCVGCKFWYLLEHAGPPNQCKRCYWGVPIDRKAILTVKNVVIMMARELEELIELAA